MSQQHGRTQPRGIGQVIAPPRFILFAIVAAIGMTVGVTMLGWREGVMGGFDVATLIFLVSVGPLMNNEAESMRRTACRNDANRAVLLGITIAVSMVVLVAVAAELGERAAKQPIGIALILCTLLLAWLFSNMIYALHYAHLFYTASEDGGDSGGIDFPKTDEPDYWDFVYFSFTLGMTFQTSDVEMTSGAVRRVAIFHCLAAFIFNLGVLAFTINVIGGGS